MTRNESTHVGSENVGSGSAQDGSDRVDQVLGPVRLMAGRIGSVKGKTGSAHGESVRVSQVQGPGRPMMGRVGSF